MFMDMEPAASFFMVEATESQKSGCCYGACLERLSKMAQK
jgi:hypothetical protein